MSRPAAGRQPRPSVLPAAIVLGVGLGGFVDGIVLHQLLQWHHMLTANRRYPSGTVRGLEVNTAWDGAFHALTWVAVVLGLVLLWRALTRTPPAPAPAQTLVGGLAIGWGAFNLVEGVIDHHILRIHHVRDDVAHPLPWDLGFLALGAVLVGIGVLLVRRAPDPAPADQADTVPPATRTAGRA